MNEGRAMRSWATHLNHPTLPLLRLIYTIYNQPITIRKTILTACQVQPTSFLAGSRFFRRNTATLRELIPIYTTTPYGTPTYTDHLSSFLRDHYTLFSTPIMCGFVSMLVRYLPYADYSSSIAVREETIAKEISAALSTYHPICLNYSSIFGPASARTTPLHSGIASPETASEIHIGLRKARFVCSTKLFVPKVAEKTILRDYTAHFPHEGSLRRPREIRSLVDVEEVYCRTGARVTGRTEMRTAWKGNDLKPRVYYARGPDVHFASAIIQALFNIFVDALPIVHRRNRFSFADLELMNADATLLVYDYSSFTSTLHELRHFTEALAEYCSGHYITILDGHHGPMQVDMGAVLSAYNQECNMDAEFDVSELLSIPDMILEHNTGMLGVPGNISSSTLLHGIHLAILLGSLYRGKCIGDDGLAIIFEDSGFTPESLCDAIAALGKIEFEKMEIWVDADSHTGAKWKYEKRPLERQHEVAFKGSLITWPAVNVLAGIINPYHRPLGKSPSSIFQTACRQICRFQRQLFHLEISQVEKDLILFVVREFYRSHNLDKFGSGYIGEIDIGGQSVHVILPPCTEEFFTTSQTDWMRSHYGSWVWMPPPFYDPIRADHLGLGAVFDAYPEGVVEYLRKMDFMESSRVQSRTLIGDLSLAELTDLSLGRVRFLYSYVVVDHLPAWAPSLLSQYSSMA